MFPTLIRRLADSYKSKIPKTVSTGPYQTRKVWPPNFSNLNTQQQLRFEKKWKRRMGGVQRSPAFVKGIKYAQYLTIVGALIYLVFYAEFEWWGREYKPSEELADRARSVMGALSDNQRYQFKKKPAIPEDRTVSDGMDKPSEAIENQSNK